MSDDLALGGDAGEVSPDVDWPFAGIESGFDLTFIDSDGSFANFAT